MAVGRRGPRRRRVPHAMQANPAAYAQIENTISLGSLAAGSDVIGPILDNSSLFGNEFVRVVKCEFEWILKSSAESPLIVAVTKDNEGQPAYALDDQGTIIDLRSERSLLRGPWMVASKELATNMRKMKTIVLKKINLDRTDDLLFAVTNHPNGATLGASAEIMHLTKVWYRKIGG